MNIETAKILCKISTDFYQDNAVSFSETRKSSWVGWHTCLDIVRAHSLRPLIEFSVLDLACGNLRFEDFLEEALPESAIHFYAIDNCDRLVPSRKSVSYQNHDIIGSLLEAEDINEELAIPPCFLSVSFGFFHHVPGQSNRIKLLDSLIAQTEPGGFVIVSLWQFLKSEQLAMKACESTETAQEKFKLEKLEEGDFILGWKDVEGAYRYCHSFSEADINELVESVANKAKLVARFESDGRTDNLNSYLILQVNERET